MERTVAEARERGYTETLFGRRRQIPELASGQLPHPPGRRAPGHERRHPGPGRRHLQGGAGPPRRRARRERPAQPAHPPGARRGDPRGAARRARSCRRGRARRDVRGVRPAGAARGQPVARAPPGPPPRAEPLRQRRDEPLRQRRDEPLRQRRDEHSRSALVRGPRRPPRAGLPALLVHQGHRPGGRPSWSTRSGSSPGCPCSTSAAAPAATPRPRPAGHQVDRRRHQRALRRRSPATPPSERVSGADRVPPGRRPGDGR